MQDNVVFATDSLRTSVAALKKKLSNLRISIEQFDCEIERIETKFDKLLTQTDIYKAKVEREANREVRRLDTEITRLRKELSEYETEKQTVAPPINTLELKVASTMAIFECILRHMCGHSDDFRLMSYAFLFPAVYERVVKADDLAYLKERVPESAPIVIERGKEYIEFLREVCETHVTDPAAWNKYIEEVTDWWRNDALPLLYGERDEIWDEDVPLSLTEMLSWKEDPAARPLNFSAVFDAFEIYKSNKEVVYKTSGVQDLEMKMFSFVPQ
jgi:uncharacterized protein CbrC (UPF0167 family)